MWRVIDRWDTDKRLAYYDMISNDKVGVRRHRREYLTTSDILGAAPSGFDAKV
jgi:hypothetical protein